MQTISPELEAEILEPSQTVHPVVQATFADSKYLPNYRIFSASELWEDVIPKHDPLLWWRYDLETTEIDGSNGTAHDHSGNNHVAEITGPVSIVSGPLGYNGDDGAINLEPADIIVSSFDTDLELTDNLTLGTWVKLEAHTATGGIVAGKIVPGGPPDPDEWLFGFFELADGAVSDIFGFVSDGSTVELLQPLAASASLGTWYFLTLVVENQVAKYYINGVLQDTFNMTDTIPAINSSFFGGGGIDATVDETFLLDKVLTPEEILSMYEGAIIVGDAPGQSFYDPEDIINGIKEETIPYGSADALDELGDVIVANGNWHAPGLEENVEAGWRSRLTTDSSGDFVDPETIKIRFDERIANEITVYTSYTLGRINEYELSYYDDNEDLVAVGTFNMVDSFQVHDLGSLLPLTGIKITVNSTQNPEDYARIHEIDIVYKEDISDDIISFDLSKVRENYEDTLPVGVNVANSIDITLDNHTGKYNVFDNAEFSDYSRVDVKFEIGLEWDETEEEVVQGTFYADQWNFSSDSMTVGVACRDYSKFLMEENQEEGVFFTDLSAGKAISTLMKKGGFPNRKTSYYDNYINVLKRDRPIGIWQLGDIHEISEVDQSLDGEVITDNYSTNDGEIHGDSVFSGAEGLVEGMPEMKSVRFEGDEQDSRILIPESSEMDLPNEWSIEAIFNAESLPGTGENRFIAGKTGTSTFATLNYVLALTDSGGIIVAARGIDDTLQLALSDPIALGETYHVVGKFDGDAQEISIYLNGVKTTQPTSTDEVYTNTVGFGIGGASFEPSSDGFEFHGRIGPVSLYNRALTDAEVQRHFIASKTDDIFQFPYLYGVDAPLWEIMTEWALADLGTFFIDENDNFKYEYRNTIHDEEIDQHNESQYDFSDDTNIVNGDYLVELQTNKVVVEVNPITTINSDRESIWRAQSGESLVVTGLIGTVSSTDSEVNVKTTNNPLWKDEGFFKIDDEIISYSGKEGNKLKNLVRGLFGTQPAAHNGDSEWTFDENTEGWNAGKDSETTHCSVLQQTDVKRTGAGALKVTSRSSDGDLMGPASPKFKRGVEVIGDVSYSASAYTMAESDARSVKLRIIWYDEDGVRIDADDGTPSTNSTSVWTEETVTATSPENAKYAAVRVLFDETDYGEIHYIDDVTMPGTIGKVREVRVYDIEFDQAPAIGIKEPLITAEDFDQTAKLESFTHTSYSAHAIVSATKLAGIGETVLLEGTNPLTDLNYYFAISGIPLVEESSEEEVESISSQLDDLIRRYRLKELTLSNRFIQDKEYAQLIADFLIAHFENPVAMVNMSVLGTPHVQLGDRITVQEFDQLGITDEEFWIMEISISYDGGITQQMVLRQVS